MIIAKFIDLKTIGKELQRKMKQIQRKESNQKKKTLLSTIPIIHIKVYTHR